MHGLFAQANVVGVVGAVVGWFIALSSAKGESLAFDIKRVEYDTRPVEGSAGEGAQ